MNNLNFICKALPQFPVSLSVMLKKQNKNSAILIIFSDLAEARLTGYQLHTLHHKP